MIPENWTGTHTQGEFQITNCGVPFSENICLSKTHFFEVLNVATTFIFIKDGGVVVLTLKKRKSFEPVSLGFGTRCVTLEKPVKVQTNCCYC